MKGEGEGARGRVNVPELGLQLQRSLLSASKAFIGIYAVSLAAWTGLWLLPAAPKSNVTAATAAYNFGAGEAYLLAVGIAEILHFASLRDAARKDRRLDTRWSYLLAFLECFQPTFFLFTWGLVLPPEAALAQSPIFFYFLLLGAGVLRTDAALSLFSGAVAGVGFVALAYLLHVRAGSPDPWKSVTSLHLTEGVYLFATGAFMAFVAWQTRKSLVQSIAAGAKAERIEQDAADRERLVQEREALAVMRERENLVEELHDTVTQKIAWLSLAAESLKLEAAGPPSPSLGVGLARLAAVAAEAQTDVRDFIHDARAADVRERGLRAALVDYLATLGSERDFEVELDAAAAPDPLPLSRVQEIEAFKIVQESLSNSRKHAGTGRARLSIAVEGEELVLRIEDEGKGFDPEAAAPARHYGLEIMARRAEAAGGRLSVSASAGRGTRIEIRFGGTPANGDASRHPAGVEDRGLSRNFRDTSVFVVDDHDLFREGICGLLRIAGFPVVGSASSAKEGIAVIRTARPDVVLLDVRMPDLDGIGATALVKSEFPDMSIILLTGSPDEKGLYEAMKVGASAYLPKSTPAWELVATIEGVAAGELSLDAGMAAKILADFPPADGPVSTRGEARERIESLSPRQREILDLVRDGLTYKEVGARLGITERTIKWHMGTIIELLQVRNKAEAIKAARAAAR